MAYHFKTPLSVAAHVIARKVSLMDQIEAFTQ
jgi:hypothetical protein